jgi:hypothetical protein
MEKATILSLIFSFVSSISTLLILLQLFLSRRQAKAEHESLRRQKTVEIMLDWSKSLKRETSCAVKLVEKFDKNRCIKLYNQESFTIDEKSKNLLCEICSLNKSSNCALCAKKENGEYEVCGKQLSILRWHIMSYLNTLESVFVAWQQGIVDSEVIEQQFAYVYDSTQNRDVLRDFREAAGGIANFPAIDAFCKQIAQKREKANKVVKKRSL